MARLEMPLLALGQTYRCVGACFQHAFRHARLERTRGAAVRRVVEAVVQLVGVRSHEHGSAVLLAPGQCADACLETCFDMVPPGGKDRFCGCCSRCMRLAAVGRDRRCVWKCVSAWRAGMARTACGCGGSVWPWLALHAATAVLHGHGSHWMRLRR